MTNTFKKTSLTTFVNTGFSLFMLRFFAGMMLFYNHGYSKIVNVLNSQFQFADPIGIGPVPSLILAAFAEGICTIFLMAGFYTRLMALLLVINFIVAYFAAYKELALLYLLVFGVIFLLGPGRWSVDLHS